MTECTTQLVRSSEVSPDYKWIVYWHYLTFYWPLLVIIIILKCKCKINKQKKKLKGHPKNLTWGSDQEMTFQNWGIFLILSATIKLNVQIATP